jgi:hypothetical protein
MSLPARAFQASNHHQMGSNAINSQKQGGGDKKAGLVYQVGRTQWTNIALGTNQNFFWPSRKRCCTASQLAVLQTKSSISRPIGSTLQPVPYWN